MIWGCEKCVSKWWPRFCRKTVSRNKSNFVKTCYRRDSAPCDFGFFRCDERDTFFISRGKKASVTRELKRLREEDFTKCFRWWLVSCKSALTRRGSTLKGTLHKVSKYAALKFLYQHGGFLFVTLRSTLIEKKNNGHEVLSMYFELSFLVCFFVCLFLNWPCDQKKR